MSPWKTGEPVSPFDNFRFDVNPDGAKFGKDARYMEGKDVILILTGTKTFDEPIKTPDGPIERQENETVFVSLGKNWTTDDGQTAYNTEGKTEFLRTSKIGRMVDLVVESGRAGEMPGEPEEAKTWGGTTWRFGTWVAKFSGEKQTMKGAVEFLGFIDGSGATEVPANQTAATAADDTAPDPAVTRVKVETLAKKIKADGGDHSTFVAQATDIAGVADDDALLAEVIDEAGAIWTGA